MKRTALAISLLLSITLVAAGESATCQDYGSYYTIKEFEWNGDYTGFFATTKDLGVEGCDELAMVSTRTNVGMILPSSCPASFIIVQEGPAKIPEPNGNDVYTLPYVQDDVNELSPEINKTTVCAVQHTASFRSEPVQTPEFSTWGLGLAIITVGLGIAVVRKNS